MNGTSEMEKEAGLGQNCNLKELGRRLRQKRMQLGVSRYRLARFLKVSWPVVKKWETGILSECGQILFARRLRRFLEGEYDGALGNGLPMPSEDAELSPELAILFRKARRVFQLCEESPAIRLKMLANLKERARAMLARLSLEKRLALIQERTSSRRNK